MKFAKKFAELLAVSIFGAVCAAALEACGMPITSYWSGVVGALYGWQLASVAL